MSIAEFLLLTNSPPPYRVHLFSGLAREFDARGVSFGVIILGDRPVLSIPDDWPFPWQIVLAPRLLSWLPHTDPRVAVRPQVRGARWLMVGGYFNPTLVLTALGPRVVGQRRLLWLESATANPTDEPWYQRWFKKRLVGRFDDVVVPGDVSDRYVRALSMRGSTQPRIVRLPNVIDEKSFLEGVRRAGAKRMETRLALGVKDEALLLLVVSRLVPQKGLLALVDAMPADSAREWVLVIAGEGPQRGILEKRVLDRKLEARIRLLGRRDVREIAELYAAADFFVHAATVDRFPLAVVDALFAGLPLLISRRVCSLPEVLDEGGNGFAFSPDDPRDVRGVMLEALALPMSARIAMGVRSRELAVARLSTGQVIERFADAVLGGA